MSYQSLLAQTISLLDIQVLNGKPKKFYHRELAAIIFDHPDEVERERYLANIPAYVQSVNGRIGLYSGHLSCLTRIQLMSYFI